MPDAGTPRGARRPFEGPPSERARAALASELRREVADARTRLEEASLRAEAHRLLGDPSGAADVVREQQDILADVEHRLARVVSAGVIQRDAEEVLAAAAATHPLSRTPEPVEAGAQPDDRRPVRERSPALAGVASMVAVLAVGAAAIMGLSRGLDRVQLADVPADPTADVTQDLGPVQGPAPAADPAAPATTNAPAPAPSEQPATEAPDDRATAPAADATGEATPEPDPTPELDAVVEELVDAVAGLGQDNPFPSDPSDPGTETPDDVDASGPDLDTISGGLGGGGIDGDPAPDPTATPDGDGFVPDPSGQ